jgi:hypothetical protein
MSENIMAECIRWMSMPELPKAESLREQIIDTVLLTQLGDGPAGCDVEDVVSGLLSAYDATVLYEADEDDDVEVVFWEPAAAEKLMIKLFIKVLRFEIPWYKDYTDDDLAEHWWWPDALKHDRHGFESTFVRKLAIALGYLDAKRTKQLAEYHREMEAKEAANG